MRRLAADLDANLTADAPTEAVRVVTTDFDYTAQISDPASDSTTTAGPSPLNDAVADIGDAVYALDNGSDLILGTDAADVLYGGGGNDLMAGGLGDDALSGGDDDDTILGQDGNDALHGDHGHDWILGDAGNDLLFGGMGDDTLEGGLGDDRLEGGIGNDVMKGGDGNDTLVAGSGNDVMTGGAGRDTFVVNAAGYYHGGLDRITDFEVGASHYGGRDMIDLRPALAGSTFTGSTIREALQQGYIYFVEHGKPGDADFGTTIYLDRNGHASDYGHDVALVELAGVAKSDLHLGYYGGNFIV